jgi:lipopolysaccharide assembly outer membrane protein LptD (OstA)
MRRCSLITLMLVLLSSACSSRHASVLTHAYLGRHTLESPKPITVTVRSQRVGSQYVYLTKRRKDNSKAYVLRSDMNVAKSAGEGTGSSEFTNPHIVFSGREGQQLVADAPHAVILMKERSLLMNGGVRAQTSDGMFVKADTLTYNEMTDRLHGVGHVLVTTPRGERLTGDRIDANLHLSEMRIFHDRY